MTIDRIDEMLKNRTNKAFAETIIYSRLGEFRRYDNIKSCGLYTSGTKWVFTSLSVKRLIDNKIIDEKLIYGNGSNVFKYIYKREI